MKHLAIKKHKFNCTTANAATTTVTPKSNEAGGEERLVKENELIY